MILELNRVGENSDTTFGVLSKVTFGDRIMPICCIIENSWKDNKQDVSCIPKGVYSIYRNTTSKTTTKGESFFVEGVPYRTGILFHVGNTHLDTKGCFLTVSRFGWLLDSTGNSGSILGGFSSLVAFDQFFTTMEGVNEATLVIKGGK